MPAPIAFLRLILQLLIMFKNIFNVLHTLEGIETFHWIDVWNGDSSTVVFLHGDVKWGDEL